MKRIIITAFILLLPMLASAQVRVGVMNPETVLDALPGMAEIQTEIQAFEQQRAQQFQTQYASFMEDYSAFQQEQPNLSQAQQTERMEEFMSREEELQALEQQLQSQIETRWNELFNPIMNRVDTAVQTVAEEMDLDFIFNEVTAQGDPLVYFSSDRVFNITNQVIETVTNN